MLYDATMRTPDALENRAKLLPQAYSGTRFVLFSLAHFPRAARCARRGALSGTSAHRMAGAAHS